MKTLNILFFLITLIFYGDNYSYAEMLPLDSLELYNGGVPHVAVGDINNDGNEDVIAYHGSRKLLIWLGNGDGTFQEKNEMEIGISFSLNAGDFNNDGYMDIYTYKKSFLGSETGTFTVINNEEVEVKYPYIFDIDGDDFPDIIGRNEYAKVITFYKGNGDGTFDTGIPLPELGRYTYVESVKDYNNDSIPDILASVDQTKTQNKESIITYTWFSTFMFYGKGDGTYEEGIKIIQDGGSEIYRRVLESHDVNNDKTCDLVSLYFNLETYLKNDEGDYQVKWSTPDEDVNSQNSTLTIFDINNDQIEDIVCFSRFYRFDSNSYETKVVVFIGYGDGTYASGYYSDLEFSPLKGAITADFNSDKKDDVLLYGSDTITILMNNSVLTEVNENKAHSPSAAYLENIYPNPFNSRCSIPFTLPKASLVEVGIYDVVGRKIKSMLFNTLPAGAHRIIWNGTDDDGQRVANGVYFCMLKNHSTNMQSAKKILFLK